MKHLILALLLVICGVNADDYEEFLEYKKWKESNAKIQETQPKKSIKKIRKVKKKSTAQQLLKSRKTLNKNAKKKKALNSNDIAKRKSGVFIGGNQGIGLIYSISSSNNPYNTYATYAPYFFIHANMGVIVGYTYFINPNFGFRAYGGIDAGYGMDSNLKSVSTHALFSFGLDFLPEFTFWENEHFSFGAVIGIGGGGMVYNNNVATLSFRKFGFAGNYGLSFGFLHKHRFEVLAKVMPFKEHKILYGIPVMWVLNYTYTF